MPPPSPPWWTRSASPRCPASSPPGCSGPAARARTRAGRRTSSTTSRPSSASRSTATSTGWRPSSPVVGDQRVEPGEPEDARGGALGVEEQAQGAAGGTAPVGGLEQQSDAGAGEVADPAQVHGRLPGRRAQRGEQRGADLLGRGEVEVAGPPDAGAVPLQGRPAAAHRLGQVPPEPFVADGGRRYPEADRRAAADPLLHRHVLGEAADQQQPATAE